VAVDLFVLPLSRYIAGDYITPMMRACWAQGLPYEIVGPQGTRALPPDVPVGGPGAGEHRARIQEMLHEDLLKLPAAISGQLWDERSELEPRFHRLSHTEYGRLCELAQGRKGFFGFGSSPQLPELEASWFAPQEFDGAFEVEEPLRGRVASAPALLRALEGARIPTDMQGVVQVFRAALQDSVECRWPLVIDG